jgi:hypothetical protein
MSTVCWLDHFLRASACMRSKVGTGTRHFLLHCQRAIYLHVAGDDVRFSDEHSPRRHRVVVSDRVAQDAVLMA